MPSSSPSPRERRSIAVAARCSASGRRFVRVGGAEVAVEHRESPLADAAPAAQLAPLSRRGASSATNVAEALRLGDRPLAVVRSSRDSRRGCAVGVEPRLLAGSCSASRSVQSPPVMPASATAAPTGCAARSHPSPGRTGAASEPVEDRDALQVVGVEREQREEPIGDRPVAQRPHARPVGRDARGAEVIVQQPRVRHGPGCSTAMRCAGDAGGEQRDDLAHDRAHLVVGVGGMDDTGCLCRGRVTLGRRASEAETKGLRPRSSRRTSPQRPVDLRIPGQPEDDMNLARRIQCAQRTRARSVPAHQAGTRRSARASPAVAGSDSSTAWHPRSTDVSSRWPAVARSVTLRCSRATSAPSAPDRRHRRQCRGIQPAKLAVCPAECTHRRRMRRDGGEDPGSSASAARQSAVSRAEVTGGIVRPASETR